MVVGPQFKKTSLIDFMTNTTLNVPNWVGGKLCSTETWLEKFNPHNGSTLSFFSNSSLQDATSAVDVAELAFPEWSELTPVHRGEVLGEISRAMRQRTSELAHCVALETGKSLSHAKGEVSAAILQAEYYAGEGMRMFGRTLPSVVLGKTSYTVRQPHGIAALIVPANTPIANIAWKVFPALICGNTIVLKSSEDAPRTATLFAEICEQAGLPAGVLNVVHGHGSVVGAALVNDPRINVVSFTGSTSVGRTIAEAAGRRLARVSLELGGKNSLVVCDDAELDLAAHWAALSAFSNAGQRCAAGSRIVVFDSIYEEFSERLIEKVSRLKLGISDDCDLGPVISKRHQLRILEMISVARSSGGRLLTGGVAPRDKILSRGFYVEPTLLDEIPLSNNICQSEIFGPVATLHRVSNIQDALTVANDTQYGLTASVHTRNIDRALWFTQRVRAGVANVNLGTYGSEPHMPFGGFGISGNGTREPGVEALDVYSELKNISMLTRHNLT